MVGLDGGYVHSSQQQSRADGWFEVIAGKAIPADGRPACFGYVQTYDTKPRRRLFELLKAQGMQMNQQVTFLTDGGNDVRELPLYLNPPAIRAGQLILPAGYRVAFDESVLRRCTIQAA